MKLEVSKESFRLFGLNGSLPFAKKVADHLGIELSAVTSRHFSDGEVLACAGENVRNRDCYIIYSPYTDEHFSINDKLIQVFMLVEALREASARSVTWVKQAPAYDRQDRKTKPREPIATKVMGCILDSLYLDRIITLDPHNLVATQNSMRRTRVDVLQARKPMADAIVPYIEDPSKLVIQAPDSGGINRTKEARKSLEKRLGVEIPLAYFDKEHAEEQEKVTGNLIVGDVRGKDVLVWDDIIGTGCTIKQNKLAIEMNGGNLKYVVATHFYGTTKFDRNLNRDVYAWENLKNIDHIFCSDSMCSEIPWRIKGSPIENNIHVVDLSLFIAKALCETDKGGSINDLLKD